MHSTTQQITNAQSTYIITIYQTHYSFVFTISSALVVIITKLTILFYYYYGTTTITTHTVKSSKKFKNSKLPQINMFDSEGHPYVPSTSILTTLGGFASPTHASLGSTKFQT